MALTVPGTLAFAGYCASLRATRMQAAINSTHLLSQNTMKRVKCLPIGNGEEHELDTIRHGHHRYRIATSLTDWFFAGDSIHRRYTYPEIWRHEVESKAIAMTSPLPFLTCGFFAYMVARLGLHGVSSGVSLAVAVWLIGPLPLILTNAAFMKLHRVFVMSYAIGWLTKLVLVGLAVGSFLR
jgi:hypothetical protein